MAQCLGFRVAAARAPRGLAAPAPFRRLSLPPPSGWPAGLSADRPPGPVSDSSEEREPLRAKDIADWPDTYQGLRVMAAQLGLGAGAQTRLRRRPRQRRLLPLLLSPTSGPSSVAICLTLEIGGLELSDAVLSFSFFFNFSRFSSRKNRVMIPSRLAVVSRRDGHRA